MFEARPPPCTMKTMVPSSNVLCESRGGVHTTDWKPLDPPRGQKDRQGSIPLETQKPRERVTETRGHAEDGRTARTLKVKVQTWDVSWTLDRHWTDTGAGGF
ncbi:unnamed protein product [Pleuronectes platessa]|uniref:Uncharacterized protein n=1 Tax=Pleuronectes platessa TaxID=8262 RepID=A0A9N7ZCE2_PLEPL|nr:unnamed protein product [Pleuronectes platessa]